MSNMYAIKDKRDGTWIKADKGEEDGWAWDYKEFRLEVPKPAALALLIAARAWAACSNEHCDQHCEPVLVAIP